MRGDTEKYIDTLFARHVTDVSVTNEFYTVKMDGSTLRGESLTSALGLLLYDHNCCMNSLMVFIELLDDARACCVDTTSSRDRK